MNFVSKILNISPNKITGDPMPSNIQQGNSSNFNWIPIIIIVSVITIIVTVLVICLSLKDKDKNKPDTTSKNNQPIIQTKHNEIKKIDGKTISIQTEETKSIQTQEKATKSATHTAKTICVVLLVFLLTGILTFVAFALFVRMPASQADISLRYEPNLTRLGVDCVVYANEDIKDLELDFTFYNSNRKEVHRLHKYVGDIKKHEERNITISLYESMQGSDLPSYCSIQIASGTVNFFASFA